MTVGLFDDHGPINRRCLYPPGTDFEKAWLDRLCPPVDEDELRDLWISEWALGPDLDHELDITQRCPVCGATGACGYDEDGLPVIHAIPARPRVSR
ncbi:MAG: hypothetical protein AAFZ07_19655 [Actinomycetota bacterium]